MYEYLNIQDINVEYGFCLNGNLDIINKKLFFKIRNDWLFYNDYELMNKYKKELGFYEFKQDCFNEFGEYNDIMELHQSALIKLKDDGLVCVFCSVRKTEYSDVSIEIITPSNQINGLIKSNWNVDSLIFWYSF